MRSHQQLYKSMRIFLLDRARYSTDRAAADEGALPRLIGLGLCHADAPERRVDNDGISHYPVDMQEPGQWVRRIVPFSRPCRTD